ncbi:hypothetical protein NQ176_g7115 [Zarea fungicola]|uniref:Uncharacterized protein n=1 Tax=Zarea fungicola TaxID=93591 RepID=A0ACC1N1Z9_9HYPO|nr:hypothetical protein NQ176_g7115 [Lecanicillium fungicola]
MDVYRRLCQRRSAFVLLAVFCVLSLYASTSSYHARLSHSVSRLINKQNPELCHSQGWSEYTPSSTKRKVYDLFMVNTELDWLEIRLATLYPVVDYFVVVEAGRTFTGLKKELVVKDNWARFLRFHDKIIYHEVEYPADYTPKDAWETEEYTRNAMVQQALESPSRTGPQKPHYKDVLVITDVDEIPRPETIRALRHCNFPRRVTLWSRFYYYSFQFLHVGPEWYGPKATFYDGADTVLPHDLRASRGKMVEDKGDMSNASWHCSSCFSTISTRIGNGSWIMSGGGKDMWERPGEHYERLAENTDVPPYVRDHPDKFGYMLNRDGENAGFFDTA